MSGFDIFAIALVLLVIVTLFAGVKTVDAPSGPGTLVQAWRYRGFAPDSRLTIHKRRLMYCA